MSKVSSEFAISRVFNAPQDRVWKAWTESQQLNQWFGPKDCPIFHSTMEFHPGGFFHYGLKTPGGDMWGKWFFREIHAPDKLVTIASFPDKDGNITRAPFAGTWPLEMISMMTFTNEGDKTLVTIRTSALNATEEEETTFREGLDGMTKGWSGTFDQLEKFLA